MATSLFGLPTTDAMFSGVVMISSQCGDLSHGELVHGNTPVILCQPNVSPGRISMFNYQAHREDSLVFLTSSSTSWMRRAPSLEQGLLPDLVELCAGSGGMGTGTKFLGGRIMASFDVNPLAAQHFGC